MHQTSRLVDLIQKTANKKAILLDFDNTLYPFDPCHKKAIEAIYLKYCHAIQKISRKSFDKLYHQAMAKVKKQLKGQAASHSRLLYYQTLLEDKVQGIPSQLALQWEKLYWKVYLKEMRLNAWVMPFLRTCRKRNQTTVLVTNLLTQIQLQKLRKLKLSPWIDFIVTSEEAGAEKPAPQIFQLALNKAQCRLSQTILIGDNPREDRHPGLQVIYV